MVDTPRERLLGFLEQQLFRPVLGTNPSESPEFRRDEVEGVRREVAEEHEALITAESEDVLLRTMREAAARSARSGLEQRLQALGMPTFAGQLDELEKLSRELGVNA